MKIYEQFKKSMKIYKIYEHFKIYKNLWTGRHPGFYAYGNRENLKLLNIEFTKTYKLFNLLII